MKVIKFVKDSASQASITDIYYGAKINWPQTNQIIEFLEQRGLLGRRDDRFYVTGEGQRALDFWEQFQMVIEGKKQ